MGSERRPSIIDMSKIRPYKRDLIILLLELFVVIPFIATLSLNCAHSVDYETLHDTDTVIHRDTIKPTGPAFIRFLAILDNGSTVVLKSSPLASSPFTTASSQIDQKYLPIRNDSPFVLYASYFTGLLPGTQHFDSITIPADSLKSFSLTSILIFQTRDSGIFPLFANDSLKKVNAPKGFCYFRFVNGLPDYPQPEPSVNIHLDNSDASPLFNNPPGAVLYQEMRNYVLIPIGFHNVIARSEIDPTQFYSASLNFEEGHYYTARLVGIRALSTDKFIIDAE